MIVLYDDARARTFEPFATSRPLGEMRVGALLVRERWERVLGDRVLGFVSGAHLEGFSELDAPAPMAETVLAGTWIVNTRSIPHLTTGLPSADVLHGVRHDVLHIDGAVAAVRLSDDLATSALRDGTQSLEALAGAPTATRPTAPLDGAWLHEVWDIIGTLTTLLLRDLPVLAASLPAASLPVGATPTVVQLGDHPVFVEAGGTIEPMTIFDTTAGPVLVRRGATVQAFTRVIGPCYIGCDSTITADRIAASSIGDSCRVHGELSTSVFIGHANKGHDGFVGHSIVGRWVNLGAGTTTSNLKNTYGTVALWTTTGVRDTGLQFLGTLFGDHVKTGIGLRLTTGCVLGTGANVFDAMPPKMVAPFSWGARAPYAVFDAVQFIRTAERMMARRHVALTAEQRAWWLVQFERAAADARWPRG